MVNEAEARFEARDGRLVMYAYDLSWTNYWGLSAYPALTDAYLEGVFITGPECRGRDRYGFIVRAPSPQFGIVVPNQTNRLGVWMEGNTMKIYINRRLVGQVTDNVYTQGRFGVVVGARETSGFWAAVDEVAYWLLP